MRTDRGSRRAGVHVRMAVVIGLLTLGARAGAAQDTSAAQAQDTTPMTLVVAVFPDQAAATQAMSAAQAAPSADHLEYSALVSKDQSGGIRVRQKHGKKGASSDPRASKAVDGAIALLGHPANSPLRSTDSTAVSQAGLSQADANNLQAMLPPGGAAVIFVVAEPYASDMDSAMQQAHAKQVLDAKLQTPP